MYEILADRKPAKAGTGTIGGLIELYFTGKIPASGITERVRETICPVPEEAQPEIEAALLRHAVRYYNCMSEEKQAVIISEAVREIISLL